MCLRKHRFAEPLGVGRAWPTGPWHLGKEEVAEGWVAGTTLRAVCP